MMPFDLKPVQDRFAEFFLIGDLAYTGRPAFFKHHPDVERYRLHTVTCKRRAEG